MGNTPARVISLGLSLTVAGVLLYFSLRGLDWNGVFATVRAARPERILVWLAFGSVSFVLRAARWRVLLSASRPAPYPTVFWATCAGYFGNSFLPARAGELVRSMAVSARTGLSVPYVLTTALSERIVDAVTLLIISSSILLFLPSRPGWFQDATKVFVPLGLGGALAILLIPRLEKFWRTLLRKLPISEGLRQKADGILDQVMRGAESLHDAGRLASFFGLTAVIWLGDAVATVIGGWALGIPIPLTVAFLLIAGLGLGSAIPSTPGYVGIYQFVATSVLVPFGIAKSDAIAYILVAQGLQYINVLLWGPLSLWKLGGWRRWTSREPERSSETVPESVV